MHPIYSIFFLFNPFYPRTLRITDFFFSIHLSFFFSLMPIYIYDNPQLKELEATRNILNRKKRINDLAIMLYQVKLFNINLN